MMVSYLIEKRAMAVYPSYAQKVEDQEIKGLLKKIIVDEKDHLDYLEDKLSLLPETEAFKKSSVWENEEDRFQQYLAKFCESLPSAIH